MGAGCDCTGISKADWVQFYGRWDKARFLDGRHWCPQCMQEVKQTTLTGNDLFRTSATYIAHSGIIPTTQPHHYEGNLELWQRKYGHLREYGKAVLLQGDSRQLVALLQGQVECCVASPPFLGARAGTTASHATSGGGPCAERVHTIGSDGDRLGTSPGQLGAMPPGSVEATLALSSPPYGGYDEHGGRATAAARDEKRLQRLAPEQIGKFDTCFKGSEQYGNHPGQLGRLPSGDVSIAISSPPFAASTQVNVNPGDMTAGKAEWKDGTDSAARVKQDYHQGTTPGNLGSLAPGEITAVISSPPYADRVITERAGHLEEGRLAQKGLQDQRYGLSRGTNPFDGYGSTPGNLGNLAPGVVADAVVSSPPWDEGSPSLPVSRQRTSRSPKEHGGPGPAYVPLHVPDNFWAAAKTILEQTFQALKSGGEPVSDGEGIEFCSCI